MADTHMTLKATFEDPHACVVFLSTINLTMRGVVSRYHKSMSIYIFQTGLVSKANAAELASVKVLPHLPCTFLILHTVFTFLPYPNWKTLDGWCLCSLPGKRRLQMPRCMSCNAVQACLVVKSTDHARGGCVSKVHGQAPRWSGVVNQGFCDCAVRLKICSLSSHVD
jgi:hypothetical protein